MFRLYFSKQIQEKDRPKQGFKHNVFNWVKFFWSKILRNLLNEFDFTDIYIPQFFLINP